MSVVREEVRVVVEGLLSLPAASYWLLLGERGSTSHFIDLLIQVEQRESDSTNCEMNIPHLLLLLLILRREDLLRVLLFTLGLLTLLLRFRGEG